MANKAFGVINSAPNYIRVEGLHDYRPIGAFTFIGRFRVIDFPLSNMSNSGINRIHVYLNSRPRSLVEHIGSGRHYNINSKRGNLQLLFTQQNGANSIYNTDITAYMENLEQLERMPQDYVIVAPSYMVYKQDFQKLLDEHVEAGNDITLLYHKVDQAKEYYRACNVVELNKQKGVQSLTRNMGTAKDKNISMDTYVMSKDLFIALIKKAKRESSAYSFADIIALSCDTLDIRGYQHKGYFAAITSLDDFYRANMELLDYGTAMDFFKQDWPFYTHTTDACPTHYYPGAKVVNSLVCNAATIEGTVENSIIGRHVHIGKGAIIKNSIILSYSDISDGTYIENAVIDKWVKVKNVKKIVSESVTPAYIKRNDVL
ncbi:glucose-1-phosphate adenylyltransferase subunit GlgD [Butyrivibrio fibrisolvens]|uniref:glucose-1-phosphate adenylyltransferase subunit GlgD n=1 Tax=Pseudobutyrivibrio ruminis TaxID=46206 RepID=UPI0003F6A837|nr:glucose-1-phosphate adenylyltransferase subunit GlgD [Pseudobutyrivibrio ruminis]MDC7279845.1 glucose-1-phosphate adenylyltransferase subunit GlgD [Butyrivibrio fibrisolvens]